MTTYAKIGDTEVSDFLKGDINIYLKATDGVGRFDLNLVTEGDDLLAYILPDGGIEIKQSNITILKGYVERGLPLAEDGEYMHQQSFAVVGRDYGQDLFNRLVVKGAGFGYGTQAADDIIDDMLSEAGVEVTFTSASALPDTSYKDAGDEFLIEALRKICEKVDCDFYVDNAKALHVFPVGTISSGITVKCVAGASDNNVVGQLKTTKFDCFELRNRIKVTGQGVADGWSDGNIGDWTGATGNILNNEITIVAAGVASLKCDLGDNEEATCSLIMTFPKHNYDYLPFDLFLVEEELSVLAYIHTGGPTEYPNFAVMLKDSNDSVIQYWYFPTENRPRDMWHKYSFPIGLNIPIEDYDPSFDAEKWYYFDEASEALGFNWQIEQVTFITQTWPDFLIVDGLTIPVAMLAIAPDPDTEPTASQTAYKLREWPETKREIYTQQELDEYAASELDKMKDPIASVNVTVKGDAGFIGGVNKWIVGTTVDLLSPDDGWTLLTEGITNGGFETGSMVPWIYEPVNTQINSAVKHSGTFAVQFISMGEEGWYVQQSGLAIKTSGINSITFWSKGTSQPYNYKVELFYGNPYDYQEIYLDNVTTTDWVQQSVTGFYTSSELLTSIKISYNYGFFDQYIDDISIQYTDPPPSVSGSDLVMREIHLQILEKPINGVDFLAHLTLVPAALLTKGSRLSQIDSPEVALLRELWDRIRTLEQRP